MNTPPLPEQGRPDTAGGSVRADTEELSRAIQELWRALAEAKLYPPDRLTLAAVFVVGLVVGVHDGLGLLSPFYALLLVGLAAALCLVIDALAKAKAP